MHDAHRRPIGWSPAQRRRRHVPPSLLSTSRFSPRRPAGRPFQLPFAFAEPALCRLGRHIQYSYSYSYELHRPGPVPSPFALVKSFPPCPAYRDTSLYRRIMWPAATECVHGSRRASHFQHDSGIIFCTSLAALPSHQLSKRRRECGSLSRGTLFVPPTFFSLSLPLASSLHPHCHHQIS